LDGKKIGGSGPPIFFCDPANIMETGETAFLTTLAVKRKFIKALFSSTQRCAEE
jgi:hypothetical protein